MLYLILTNSFVIFFTNLSGQKAIGSRVKCDLNLTRGKYQQSDIIRPKTARLKLIWRARTCATPITYQTWTSRMIIVVAKTHAQ